jgi:UDP-N-acetylmuramoyl-tripeptide--D-alanyl-D-alanine ligase
MIPLSLAHLAAATGGVLDRVVDPDVLVTGALSFDSRQVAAGGLFACLPGTSVDGHDFARQAVDAGAVAALSTRPLRVPALVVPDVHAAMADVAARVSAAYTGTVMALTGSAGKTSTKDMLEAILQLDGPTVATEKSFNNEIGFPVTVSRVEHDTRYLVLEMGARGRGHIASLCEIAPPTIATVLGIGSAHIGEFGSIEAIADAKAEIIRCLPEGGVAVLNADDPLVLGMAHQTDAEVTTFGTGPSSTVRASDIGIDSQGRPHLTLHHHGQSGAVQLRVHGRHNATNALAAAATALAAGVPFDTVLGGLRTARILSGSRMDPIHRGDDVTIVDDTSTPRPKLFWPRCKPSATWRVPDVDRSRFSGRWPNSATTPPPGTTRSRKPSSTAASSTSSASVARTPSV